MELAATNEFMLFCLIMMRMSGFVFLNPVLGRRNIPAYAKSGMVMALAIMIYPLSSVENLNITSSIVFGVLLLKEFALGYLIGFIMQLFDFVVVYAGAIMDFQMGLSMATVYDMQSGTQIPLTGNILQIFYMLLFFAVDGHLALMQILVTSSEVVPYAQIAFAPESGMAMLGIFMQCVVLAVKLAFPIIAIEFLAEIGVGILMKIIPQINLFVLNIQLKIALGIIMLLILSSPISDFLNNLVTTMIGNIQDILRLAAG